VPRIEEMVRMSLHLALEADGVAMSIGSQCERNDGEHVGEGLSVFLVVAHSELNFLIAADGL